MTTTHHQMALAQVLAQVLVLAQVEALAQVRAQVRALDRQVFPISISQMAQIAEPCLTQGHSSQKTVMTRSLGQMGMTSFASAPAMTALRAALAIMKFSAYRR